MTKERKAKTPNYTEEQVAYMQETYVPGNAESVAVIAEKLGRDKRKIIAKLVHMKIYQPADKSTSAGVDEGPSKKDLLNQIATNPAFTDVADGFAGATKAALQRVIDAFPAQAE